MSSVCTLVEDLPAGMPEAAILDDLDFSFSKTALTFNDPKIEASYRDGRDAVVARRLPWLLGIIASLVMLGGLIDFLVLDDTMAAIRMLIVRGVIAAIMLAGLARLVIGGVPSHLQSWIAGGLCAVQSLWLLAAWMMAGYLDQYFGILPVNVLMVFVVSGLMFRYARWIGGVVALASALMIFAYYPQAPWGPVFYLMVLSFYAAYAAYVAERARRDAWVEKDAHERLLQNVLPPVIASRMQCGERRIADEHHDACVLFADIVGFTAMSQKMNAAEVVGLLSEIFTRFDAITDELDLEKIKTIGDCYMVAGGLPITRKRDPQRIALAAIRMQHAVSEIGAREGVALSIRAGVHTGPVVAGVIGNRKFVYDLWGDTVNTASRLEAAAKPGQVYISAQLQAELPSPFATEFVDQIRLKGRDQATPVWRLVGHAAEPQI